MSSQDSGAVEPNQKNLVVARSLEKIISAPYARVYRWIGKAQQQLIGALKWCVIHVNIESVRTDADRSACAPIMPVSFLWPPVFVRDACASSWSSYRVRVKRAFFRWWTFDRALWACCGPIGQSQICELCDVNKRIFLEARACHRETAGHGVHWG